MVVYGSVKDLQVTPESAGYTRVVCAVIRFIEISDTQFVRYERFGRVLGIPGHQNVSTGFQIKLVRVHLEDCSTVVPGVNCVGFRSFVLIKRR